MRRDCPISGASSFRRGALARRWHAACEISLSSLKIKICTGGRGSYIDGLLNGYNAHAAQTGELPKSLDFANRMPIDSILKMVRANCKKYPQMRLEQAVADVIIVAQEGAAALTDAEAPKDTKDTEYR
jgi:hypothetical protein